MSELMGELVRLGFLIALWAFGIWVGGASVAAWVAWERGREPVAWFVLAFFLSPLVALIALSAVRVHHLAPRRTTRAAAAERVGRLMNGAHTEDVRGARAVP
jgi:phosphoglycerol transferase MdoB-like AlkP superfamily enzyme